METFSRVEPGPLGEPDATQALLERALPERNALFWGWMRFGPVFDPLRAQPRFQTLLAGIQPA